MTLERIVWIIVLGLIALGIAILVADGAGVFSRALVHISDDENADRG